MGGVRKACLIVLSTAIAAGCGPKAGGRGNAVTPDANAGVGAQLTEADMPHPKAGLWSYESDTAGPKDKQPLCLTGKLLTLFIAPPSCQNTRQKTAAGGYVMDSTCTAGDGSTTKVHAVAAGDFNADFITDFSIGFVAHAGGSGMATHNHTRSKYLGPCPAGRAADD